jgi:hypothetical protein
MPKQSHRIVQKLWNYFNILRNDLSAPACNHAGGCGHAQADGLSYLLARDLAAVMAQAGA